VQKTLPQGSDMSEQNGRGERLQVMLTGDELAALDDFRFKHRMPSRASAIRELLKRGLASLDDKAAAAGSKSRDFGVIRTTADSWDATRE
jgi:hypothetical protein